MPKPLRILVNLLLPPGVATLLLIIVATFFGSRGPRWQEVVFVMLYAYGIAAIPSLIHTFLMERFYRRGMLPTEGRAVLVSSASGLGAGILVAVIFAISSSFSAHPRLWPWPLLGAATGAVVALLILAVSRAQRKNA